MARPLRTAENGRSAASATIAPIARPTVGEQVADSIRRLVWEGVLRGGERLNQEALAAQLGVSRIPVRDGLMALEREGLVRMSPHRGAYLNQVDEEATRDHFALFGLIYAFALERAGERADEESLATLVSAAQSAAKQQDHEALQRTTTEFWKLAVHEGGSPRLHAVSRNLVGMVPGNFFDEIDGAAAITRRSMRKMATALAARDGRQAGEVCRQHLEKHGELVVGVMRERGLYE